ncbi:MAG: biotin/lipoyl-containing protein [Vicinamibacteria bacterium]
MLLDATIDGRCIRVELRGKDGRYAVSVDGRSLEVDYLQAGRFVSLLVGGRSHDLGLTRTATGYRVSFPDGACDVQLAVAARGAAATRRVAHGPARIQAPMPGKIVRLLAAPGEEVRAGQGLVVIEAMKMENELRAPRAGTLREVKVSEGQAVETGALLALVD